MFPPLTPSASGLLAVTDGNAIYWECSGNPHGAPVLYIHGGPGSGAGEDYRRWVDPATHLIVGFDQRGCGRSTPLVTDPTADLASNTTPALIADIESLRSFLGLETWTVCGTSWGSGLAIAYGQAHPNRTSGLLLAAVTTTSSDDVSWITERMGRVFPREYEAFLSAVEREPGELVVSAYARALRSPDPGTRSRAAEAWCEWEDVHVSLTTGGARSPRFSDPAFRELFATLVTHYWSHAGFGGDDLLDRMTVLHGIPGILIHGRLDISSPLDTAWRIHRAWPGSELVIVDEGHGGPTMSAEIVRGLERLDRLRAASPSSS